MFKDVNICSLKKRIMDKAIQFMLSEPKWKSSCGTKTRHPYDEHIYTMYTNAFMEFQSLTNKHQFLTNAQCVSKQSKLRSLPDCILPEWQPNHTEGFPLTFVSQVSPQKIQIANPTIRVLMAKHAGFLSQTISLA